MRLNLVHECVKICFALQETLKMNHEQNSEVLIHSEVFEVENLSLCRVQGHKYTEFLIAIMPSVLFFCL